MEWPIVVLKFQEYSQDGKHPMVVVLSHDPKSRLDMRHHHHSHIHLFGHKLDDYIPNNIRAIDVGVDNCNYAPISLESVMDRMLSIPFDGFKNHNV
jgi:calcineurin-like phosphoesterase family protein